MDATSEGVDGDELMEDDGLTLADEIDRVVLVAVVGEGPPPAESSGQTASPAYAYVTSTVSVDPSAQPPEPHFSLHLLFDEGLSVLREQYWGSRTSLEEVRRGAELCGVPQDRWRPAHQDWVASAFADPTNELPEALQPATGPRLNAQHSYQFAIWRTEASVGHATAEVEFRELFPRQDRPRRELSPALSALVEHLLAEHPYTTEPDYSMNPWDDHPASWAFWDRAQFNVKFWAVPAFMTTLPQAAVEHGFDAYDPQTGDPL